MNTQLALLTADDDAPEGEPYFLHGGFCLVGLPHQRPIRETEPWVRAVPNYSLMISPGQVFDGNRPRPVGLPWGAVARLINIYLHSEATRTKSATVDVGGSMNQWFRRLDMPVNGQNYARVRDQLLRIARCSLTIKREDEQSYQLRDARMIVGLDALKDESGGWIKTIHISPEFFDHLRNHSTPINPQAVSALKSSSLALDLYLYLTYRLPKLHAPLRLTWPDLAQHFGGLDASRTSPPLPGVEGAPAIKPRKGSQFGRDVRKALDRVMSVYQEARVEHVEGGLRLHPSRPSVARSLHVVKKNSATQSLECDDKTTSDPLLVQLRGDNAEGRRHKADSVAVERRRRGEKRMLGREVIALSRDPVALAAELRRLGIAI